MLPNIKLVATDLDGTILEKGEIANPEDLRTLIELQEKGIQLTIATGQDWSNARNSALILKIDQHLDYLICNNGAYISRVSKYEPIYRYTIGQVWFQKVYNYAVKKDFCWLAFYDKLGHVYWNGVPLRCESMLKRHWDKKYIWDRINQKPNFQFDQVVQMMVFVPENEQVNFQKWWNDQNQVLNQHLLMMETNIESMPIYELINRQANKGNALINLIQHLKISLNEVVSFGDNYNDLTMMEKIPYSVAMGNGVAEIKAAAKYETTSNLAGGVSQFIKSEIWGEK